jgi:hypothetical protein|tara:strand:+ start:62 stop:316 length:255 start_codon:yes stop_codon:yes gene_type:complete
MAKEKKQTGSVEKMDEHANKIIRVLESIDTHLASLVYYQQPTRGFGASVDTHAAAPYINESKSLQEEIEKLVIESLRELKKENK